MWCIGEMTPEYVERMHGLLELYAEPYDPEKPVVCFDEKSKQLLGHEKEPLRGKIVREDYHYKRNGAMNIFLAVEPKGGRRYTEVARHRKKPDFAKFIRRLVDEFYPEAKTIRLVMDNLNTHNKSSFYETFTEKEAERILKKLEFHYTPKHASWLNMAEIEIGVMDRQCLNRRIPDKPALKRQVAVWQGQRNYRRAKIKWSFTKEKADEKMGKYYI
jgi:transposase